MLTSNQGQDSFTKHIWSILAPLDPLKTSLEPKKQQKLTKKSAFLAKITHFMTLNPIFGPFNDLSRWQKISGHIFCHLWYWLTRARDPKGPKIDPKGAKNPYNWLKSNFLVSGPKFWAFLQLSRWLKISGHIFCHLGYCLTYARDPMGPKIGLKWAKNPLQLA